MFFFAKKKPFSNNANKYCSLDCRNKSYVGHYRGEKAHYFREHRPGWKKIATAFKKQNNFCNGCGRKDLRLYVHHIEPYRIDKNNEYNNLVTCCAKCHAKLERFSEKFDGKSKEQRYFMMACLAAMLNDRWHIIKGMEILRERRNR